MFSVSRNWLGRSLAAVAGATILVGCTDEGLTGPKALSVTPGTASFAKAPDLGACDRLNAPEGAKVVYHVYARGVQIYRWNGSAWALFGPDAVLSADAGGKSVVGTHDVGPKWHSNSGSTVEGTVVDRCTPNPNAIAWLLLSAKASGNGIFQRVTHIQRVNTVGGLAPSTPGAFVGAEARIDYSAEYFFYRAPEACATHQPNVRFAS
jgi:hypothetical protein